MSRAALRRSIAGRGKAVVFPLFYSTNGVWVDMRWSDSRSAGFLGEGGLQRLLSVSRWESGEPKGSNLYAPVIWIAVDSDPDLPIPKPMTIGKRTEENAR